MPMWEAPLTLEELTRVWHAVQKPYRLSVSYDVRVIKIDSEIIADRATVRSRDMAMSAGGTNP